MPPPTPSPLFPAPEPPSGRRGSRFLPAVCLALALLVAGTCAGLHLRAAFAREFRVEDDARQHVFWTARYTEPGLFPNDPIADYFEVVSPLGFRLCYRVPALFGVDGLTWSKTLPALLGVGASVATFWLTVRCFGPSAGRVTPAVAGLLAVVLLNAGVWQDDDVPSATPRAFYALLFPLFFGCWLRGHRGGALGVLALQGLIYPGSALTSFGLIGTDALRFAPRWPRVRPSRERRDWAFLLAAVAVTGVTLGAFSRQTAPYRPVLHAAEARTMPELQAGGRSGFFQPDPVAFWLNNGRSGVVQWPVRPDAMWLGLALPLVLGRRRRWGGSLPGLVAVNERLRPALGRLAVVSLGLFACAHLLLFRLHLPNRYTEPVLRAVLPVLGAILLVLVGGELLRRARRMETSPVARVLWAALLLGFTLGVGNWVIGDSFARKSFPKSFFADGPQPELYRFLRAQPANVRVATLTDEARFIPSFARRGVLSGRDFAIPYHPGFYQPLRDRTRALLAVHYTEDPRRLVDFAAAHGITHFLVAHAGPNGEDRSLETNRGLLTFQPEQEAARAQVRAQRAAGRRGVLAELAATVPAFRSAEYALLSVADIRRLTHDE